MRYGQGGLNERCPQRPRYLNRCFADGGTVWVGLGGVVLLKVYHWGWTLKLYCFSLLPLISLVEEISTQHNIIQGYSEKGHMGQKYKM